MLWKSAREAHGCSGHSWLERGGQTEVPHHGGMAVVRLTEKGKVKSDVHRITAFLLQNFLKKLFHVYAYLFVRAQRKVCRGPYQIAHLIRWADGTWAEWGRLMLFLSKLFYYSTCYTEHNYNFSNKKSGKMKKKDSA